LPAPGAEVIAVRLGSALGASGFPVEAEWERSHPILFCHDWRGQNEDPRRQTEARVLWDEQTLFVCFRCKYRTITVFPDADANGRRDELWDGDVAEIFLQPDRFGEKYYKEFEVSPNGQWLDLDITPQGLRHIASGMRSRVKLDGNAHEWSSELAIPVAAVTAQFDPAQPWRVNFFRCEGAGPERFYSAWQPTGTPEPNFHVPEKFGLLRFVDGSGL
jgi:alpha-galactosidase